MKPWKIVWMLVVACLAMVGCTTEDDDLCVEDADCGLGQRCERATGQCVDQVDGSLACASASDCLPMEICHPTAKVCVQTCSSAVDCPSTAKTCDVLSGSDSRKVCKCSTDQLCNADRTTPDLVCSVPFAVCSPKCMVDPDCGTGYVCNTQTGQCRVAGGTGASCSGEGQSNCDYGMHYCNTNQCAPLPAPTCTNYTNFSSKNSLGTTGPILYGARLISAATDTAYCGSVTPKRVRVAVSAYNSVPFPQTKDDLNGFFFVRPDGTVVAGNLLVAASAGNYTVSGANRERAEIVVSLCADTSSTTYSTGFYFTGGNFLCFQANYL